jgi:hypothetical protein
VPITLQVAKIINKSNENSPLPNQMTTRVPISRKGLTVKANDQRKFDHQISGFTHCLKLWYHTMNIRCNEETTFWFLKKKMKDVPLHQLPKIFKQNLAVYFSQTMGQELPEADQRFLFDLVEPRFVPLLKKRWQRPRRKVRDCWNLLQTKVAANPVPQDMVLDAYKKHQSILSTMEKTPEHVLNHVRLYARQFAERVRSNYQEVIPLASSKACYSNKRDEGGCFKSLKEKISHVETRVNPLLSIDKTRIDPPVIYLKGSPGIGKSFICNRIVKELSSRFGLKNDVYARNFASDHFDDYHGQLIFMVDDAFQIKNTSSKQDQLVHQMIQIKSNNEFIVPMADLKSKGRKFSSEFLLMSSNISPIHLLREGNLPISCPKALLRRITPFWNLIERKGDKVRFSYSTYENLTSSITLQHNPDSTYHIEEKQIYYGETTINRFVQMVVEQAIYEHRESAENAFSSVNKEMPKVWSIPILPYRPGLPCASYDFPFKLSGENKVKAHAICEPLKVRMITKGDSNCFALKP